VLSLTICAAVASARDDREIDPELWIGRRAWLLCVQEDRPLGEDIRFVVVEGGDTPEVINEALGFPITGDDPEEPSYESIEDHGLWFEIAYANRDRLRTYIFVENGPGTELGLHYLCLSHFWPDNEGEGQ
jgi:hypothetical protein